MLSASGTAYDARGVALSRISYGAGCTDAFYPTFAGVQTCTLAFSAIVSREAVMQAKPLVVGTPDTAVLTPTFVDNAGLIIADDAATNFQTCLYASSTSQFHQAVSIIDPHLKLTVFHPYTNLVKYNAPSASCTLSGYSVSNTPLAGIPPNFYLGVNSIISPSDTVSVGYDGAFESAKPLMLASTADDNTPLPMLAFTPIIVPKNAVTLAGASGAAQTLTVPVPAGYNSAVSLSVGTCLRPSATIAFPGSTAVSQPTNVSSAPLVSVSPASAVPSSPGASVTFTVSSAGATGACILTSSADASVYGAVVAW